MKKSLRSILFAALMSCSFFLGAQTIVSTTPSKKNVLIEELTGVWCTWCPAGHKTVNDLMTINQGRVFGVNIHAGGFAPVAPLAINYHCPDGDTIDAHLKPQGYPSGIVNRRPATNSYTTWTTVVPPILNENSILNIASTSTIDFVTRKLTVLVEVYYTGSTIKKNKLTVMLLQNNIIGPQTGSEKNPAQVVGDTYRHMHMLRDIICDNGTWGDTIPTTKTGTFFTKTYVYTVPEYIQGVPVDLFNIEVLAFVSEDKANVSSVCKSALERIIPAENPSITRLLEVPKKSCDHLSSASIHIKNMGTTTINSLEMEYGIGTNKLKYIFNGTLPEAKDTILTLPDFYSEIGQQNKLEVAIVKQNSTSLNPRPMKEGTILKSVGLTTKDSIEIRIWQDYFGTQITWRLYNSDSIQVAAGGPYQNLPIQKPDTKLNTHKVRLQGDDCYTFIIYDKAGDGINSYAGAGKYEIIDFSGTILASGNGKYDKEDIRMITKYQAGTTVEITPQSINTEQGTVSGGGATNIGATTTITATPKDGFDFVNWTVNGVVFSTSPEFTIKAVENMTIVANFVAGNGITKITATSVNVYPNPVRDILTIQHNGVIDHFEVYDMRGQIVAKGVAENNQISVKDFLNGVYVLRIFTKEGVKQQRFVKN